MAAVSLAMKQPGSACPNNVLAMHSIALVWPALLSAGAFDRTRRLHVRK